MDHKFLENPMAEAQAIQIESKLSGGYQTVLDQIDIDSPLATILEALRKAQNIADVIALGNTNNKFIGSMEFRT